MRRLLLLPAVVLVAVGLVFTLQGVGMLPGSFMTGDRRWAAIGVVLILVGSSLSWLGLGRRRPRTHG
jgi:predicted permease